MEQNILAIITILLFIPQALHKIFLYSYWWQVKEYRFDRMFVFWQTQEGKKVFYPLTLWLKIALVISFFVNPSIIILGLLIFLKEDIFYLIEIVLRRARRPVFTLRVWEVILTSLIFLAVGVIFIFYFGGLVGLLIALITDISLLFSPSIAIAWTAPLVYRAKLEEIVKAKKRLQDVNPIIVGITGSYGKTSTKEFTATILAEKFKVAKTEGSENTEFGIARKVTKNVKADTEVFVVEMGAYKREEITKLCQIAPPRIGVLTAISNQHLALFGSQENIRKAKYELIEALPEDGIAVFNGDNIPCCELAKAEKRKTIVYTTREISNFKPARPAGGFQISNLVRGKDIKVNKDSVSFQLEVGGKDTPITVPLLGAHFAQNILGAAAVGIALGMTPQQVARGAAKIKPIPRTMELQNGPNGSLLVDDSYSTSFDGFLAALNWLKKVDGKKTIITPGIIELGELSDSKHQELGKMMGDMVDNVFLTNEDFAGPLTNGLGNNKAKLKIVNINNINQFISNLTKDDIVLIEGRIPESMRQKLIWDVQLP